jgi:hypothetical protein
MKITSAYHTAKIAGYTKSLNEAILFRECRGGCRGEAGFKGVVNAL